MRQYGYDHGPPGEAEQPAKGSIAVELRDYFATHAMAGMAGQTWHDPEELAKYAYRVADAMLQERAKADVPK